MNKLIIKKAEDQKESAEREFISFLKDIQTKIPRAIKEIEGGNYGRGSSITPELVGKLIRIPQENWYSIIFG